MDHWTPEWIASLSTAQLTSAWNRARKCANNSTSTRNQWRANLWDERARIAFYELEKRRAKPSEKGGPHYAN